jgi:hypothetical protein
MSKQVLDRLWLWAFMHLMTSRRGGCKLLDQILLLIVSVKKSN